MSAEGFPEVGESSSGPFGLRPQESRSGIPSVSGPEGQQETLQGFAENCPFLSLLSLKDVSGSYRL